MSVTLFEKGASISLVVPGRIKTIKEKVRGSCLPVRWHEDKTSHHPRACMRAHTVSLGMWWQGTPGVWSGVSGGYKVKKIEEWAYPVGPYVRTLAFALRWEVIGGS